MALPTPLRFVVFRTSALRLTVALSLLIVPGCGRVEAPEAQTETTAAPVSAPDLQGWNVVIIVIDALRADHLGCYGYERDTSPFIDHLAAGGVIFERAYSNSSFTGESVSALMSGLPPSASPTGTDWFAVPDPGRPTMAGTLAEAGYATGFFSDSPIFTNTGFSTGFAEYERLNLGWGNSGMGNDVTARALKFTEQHRESPFLLHLHYFDPHAPYSPPEELYKRFADTVFPEPLDVINDVRPHVPELIASGFGPGDPRFEDMVIRYDAEIALTDQSVEALVRGLEEQGLMDRTVLFITADHGEEFLEHGFVEHAWTVYPESIHVPLIVVAPKALAAARVDTPVSLIDVLPTVLDLVQISYDRPDLRGLPLFVRDDGAWTPRRFHQPVISELMVQTRNLARSVIWHESQYIAAPLFRDPARCAELGVQQSDLRKALQEGTMERVDIWREPEFEALYDLKSDPLGQHNLGDDDLVRRRIMRRVLDAYRAMCGARVPAQGATPPPAPEIDEKLQETLQNIGYG